MRSVPQLSTWEKNKYKIHKISGFSGSSTQPQLCHHQIQKPELCVYSILLFLRCLSTLRGDGDNTQQHFPVCSKKWMRIKHLPSPLFPPSPSAFCCISFLYSSFQRIFLSTSNSQECPQCLFWRAIHCCPQGYFPLSKPGSAIST